MIVRAAETATTAHAGQLRRSGEPYITHPIAVAGIVAELGLDAQTVAACADDTLSRQERAAAEAHAALRHGTFTAVFIPTAFTAVNRI